MYKSEAESPNSPILRALLRFKFCRRFDAERPSVKKQEIKCALVRVSRIRLWEIPGEVSRINMLSCKGIGNSYGRIRISTEVYSLVDVIGIPVGS